MIEYDELGLVRALNALASTQDGRVFLHALKDYTRFDEDTVAVGSPEDTYANALLRRAYLYFRKRIDSKHLIEIEHNTRKKNNDGHDNGSKRLHSPRSLSRKAMGGKDNHGRKPKRSSVEDAR